MALEKNIKLKVTADTKQADANLKSIDNRITGIGASLKSVAAIAGVTLGSAFLKDSISQFIESERAVAKLDATMKYNTKSLQDYAEELQSLTRFEDDAIISGMSLIGMFIKDEEQIKKLTKATLDLASKKEMDLSSAFDLVSKTVGSSTNALSRYGIEVEGVAGSNERATNTFKAINKLMGGSSEAEKDTTYGKIESLKNSFGDLQESLASGLAPALSETISLFSNLIALDWEGLYFNLNNIGQGFNDFFSGQTEFKKQLREMIKNQGTIGSTVLGRLIGDRNSLQQTLDKYKPIKKEIEAITNEVKEWEKVQTRIAQQIIKASNGGLLGKEAIGTGTTGIIGRTGAGAGKNGIDSRMQDFVKENSFFVEQLRGDIQILEGEFSRFWQNTFGEANSLLEQFLMNFINGLANLAAQSLFGTILNFLLPGVGSMAGKAMKPQVININLGNETVERVVVGNIRSAQQKRLL